MLVTSLAAGIALATEEALPDSPLHDVKIATEQVRLALARSPERLVAVELDVAGARLQEAAALEAQDRDAEADVAVSAYGEHLASAAAHFEESQPAPQPAQIAQFRLEVVKQLQRTLPGPNPPASGAASAVTALSIASEIAALIREDDRLGAPDIAAAAATASSKAATSVERRGPVASRADVPPSTATSTSQVTPSDRPSPNPPTVMQTAAPAATTLQSTAQPSTAASASDAASSGRMSAAALTSQAASGDRPAQSAKASTDKQKINSAAKAARDAADRAQQSAARAKQAAEKSARAAADGARKAKEK